MKVKREFGSAHSFLVGFVSGTWGNMVGIKRQLDWVKLDLVSGWVCSLHHFTSTVEEK